MRIIGIDPGTVVCGYGIVEPGGNSKLTHIASGDVRMKKGDSMPERLKVLYDSLKIVINEYGPSLLCLEKIFYHKSIRSSFALGSARGVILLLAAQHDLPVIEYNSTELKMALTGYGRAEKQQVQQMVKLLLNLHSLTMSEDSTDALALCICHIHSSVKVK